METIEFRCAVRGFHFYQKIWKPEVNQTLICSHEIENPYDLFAIKTCIKEESDEKIVGHLPLEVSRATKFLLDRGAIVTATLSSTKYRRSPLIQGGLEIACLVTAKMIATQKNKLLLDRYRLFALENYKEMHIADEVVEGSFLTEDDSSEECFPMKTKKKKVEAVNKNNNKPNYKDIPRDIRSFFSVKEKSTISEQSTSSGSKYRKPKPIIID